MTTNELLDRYLSGAITAPQEAELERRALANPVVAEAMIGLQAFPEADHSAHVSAMLEGARSQVQSKDEGARVRPLGRYGAAAAVALLIAAAVFMLPRFTDSSNNDLAMKTEAIPPLKAEDPTPEISLDAEETAPPPPASSSPTPDLRPRPKPAASPQAPAPEPEPEEVVLIEPTVTIVEADEQDFEPAPPPEPAAPISAENFNREQAERAAAERRKDQRAERIDAVGSAQGNAFDDSRAAYITGRITNENGEPIAGVLVRLPGLPLGERTDTSGIFRLAADGTASRIDISHPDYVEESVDVGRRRDDLQLTLEEKDDRKEQYEQAWAPLKIPLGSGKPGYALPEEGFNALRKRIESGKPDNVPAGKIKLSFVVNTDGTLEDFVFRGTPGQETMDYIGETIMRTSIWNVVQGEEAVRVYFKVVFE